MSRHLPNQRKSGGLVRSTLRMAALIVGIVFLLVGILGFVPGVTSGVGEMEFIGHDSQSYLLGTFQVSILHNLVHLVFGVAGVVMSSGVALARIYLLGGGVVYLLLWLYGLVVPMDSAANFVPVNGADNVLHLVLGLGMVAFGLLGARITTARR